MTSVPKLRALTARLCPAMPHQLPPLPNFLILGASRSGSSTLHAWFSQHPDIFMSEPKELWFFNRDDQYRRGLDHYRAMYGGWNEEQILGECTPVYLYRNLLYYDRSKLYWAKRDGAIARIARDLPDAKFLISLRHPLDRFVSQYRKNSRRGKLGVGPTLDAHARKAGADGMSYRADLENVRNLLGLERVRFIIFEEWTVHPHAMLSEVCQFLGTDPCYDFDTSRNVVRTGDEGRFLKRVAERLGQTGASRRITETLDAGLRCDLLEALLPDIAFVESLLGRSIPAWSRDACQAKI